VHFKDNAKKSNRFTVKTVEKNLKSGSGSSLSEAFIDGQTYPRFGNGHHHNTLAWPLIQSMQGIKQMGGSFVKVGANAEVSCDHPPRRDLRPKG
jgi:hypothetical protein